MPAYQRICCAISSKTGADIRFRNCSLDQFAKTGILPPDSKRLHASKRARQSRATFLDPGSALRAVRDDVNKEGGALSGMTSKERGRRRG
ncbi:hypothetical protein [Metallibacterium sp.]|uniref:hypothetical protein n=1 Tax=Metallibacterium sp. TaxID=2940281 RepID=UPI0026329A1F|nr:hypothetical protein [Metallibacterium sp.]